MNLERQVLGQGKADDGYLKWRFSIGEASYVCDSLWD